MAYDFGSNILVDAIRAADPKQAAIAKNRLGSLSPASNNKETKTPSFEANTGVPHHSLRSVTPSKTPAEVVMQKFEAVILTTFIEAMLPKEASNVFGEGLAGDMWKSQMAEKIATQISQNGGIGIASRLITAYQKTEHGSEPIAGVRDPVVELEKTKPQDSVSRFLKELQMNTFLPKASHNEDKMLAPTHVLDT